MFGDRLKMIRSEKGIFQKEIADRLEVAQSTVAMWETNKREPDIATLARIADLLGVSVDFLIGREIKSTPDGIRSALVDKISLLTDSQLDRLLGYLEALIQE